jgi:hypothetical protein
MTRIVLTEEQAKLLNPTEAVQVCDPEGHVLVVIPPALTSEELRQLRRAQDSTGPCVPAEQVHKTLQALEDAWQREGPLSRERAREIVRARREARGS